MPVKYYLLIFVPLNCFADSITTKDTTFSKLKYKLSTDLQYASGNVNRLLMVYQASFDIKYKKVLDINSNDKYSYGRTNNIQAENDVYLNVSATYLDNNKPTVIFFESIESSHLRYIDYKDQIGLGYSFNIIDSTNKKLNISNVVLLDRTVFYFNENNYETIRNSTRIRGNHIIYNKLHLIHETFIQPSIIDLSNYRFKTNVSLEHLLNKNLSLKLSVIESYDSIIYSTKKNNDFQILFGLAISNF